MRRSMRHFQYSLYGLDLLVWLASFSLAFWIRYPNQFPLISIEYIRIIPFFILLWSFSFFYFSLYNTPLKPGLEMVQMLKAISVGMMLLLSFSFFYRDFSYSRMFTVVFTALVFLLNISTRKIYRLFLNSIFSSIRWRKNVLILGCGKIGCQIMEDLVDQTSEYFIVGFLDDREELQQTHYHNIPCLGKILDFESILDHHSSVNEIIIAFTNGTDEIYQNIIRICVERDIKYRFVPKMHKLMIEDITVDVIGGVPIVGIKGNCLSGFNYILKRMFDIIISLILLLLLSPVMIITALMIKLISPGPVFYVQERIGYRKTPFNFIKFRSMHVNNDSSIHQEYVEKWINGGADASLKDGDTTVFKITKDPRVIPFIGSFIRKYSIDELPQLFNVLRGEMSLVGPRPCLRYEMEQYKSWHKARFDCLPGITGLWQVSGRNRISFDEMVRLDIHYLQNWRFEMDILILLKTPLVVCFDKAY